MAGFHLIRKGLQERRGASPLALIGGSNDSGEQAEAGKAGTLPSSKIRVRKEG